MTIDTTSSRFKAALEALSTVYMQDKDLTDNLAAALTAWEASKPSVWRSTKNDPPGDDQLVIPRQWFDGRWDTGNVCPGITVSSRPERYLNWTPLPNEDDGTTPEDWK
jgi:hypothetical protein